MPNPALATITPSPELPLVLDSSDISPSPTTGDVLDKRQQVVTLSVTATPSASASAAAKKGFPVAVAIPALIGGMALAIGGFLLYWWISKRRRREKQLRWERHQKRQARKRANSNTNGRPSMSSSRNPSAGTIQKTPMTEKNFIPPVPALPKNAHHPDTYNAQREQSYGQYQQQPQQPQYGHYDANAAPEYSAPSYDQQPTIEEQHSQPIDHSASAPLVGVNEKEEKGSRPGRPSRSAARVAVAEKAAETAFGDPTTRYQPKKPSPLALKAAEEKRRLAEGFRQPGRPLSESNYQETLAPPQDEYAHPPSSDGHLSAPRQTSGEWGVALGSPVHDGSFSQQQRASYSNDPYLSSGGVEQRGQSGVYANDPYAGYHDNDHVEEMDYDRNAPAKKSTWV